MYQILFSVPYLGPQKGFIHLPLSVAMSGNHGRGTTSPLWQRVGGGQERRGGRGEGGEPGVEGSKILVFSQGRLVRLMAARLCLESPLEVV